MTIAQLGLGAWQLRETDAAWLDTVAAVARWLVEAMEPDGSLRFQFAMAHTFPLRAGWLSAMAQGEAASLLVRAAHDLADAELLGHAMRATGPLTDEQSPARRPHAGGTDAAGVPDDAPCPCPERLGLRPLGPPRRRDRHRGRIRCARVPVRRRRAGRAPAALPDGVPLVAVRPLPPSPRERREPLLPPPARRAHRGPRPARSPARARFAGPRVGAGVARPAGVARRDRAEVRLPGPRPARPRGGLRCRDVRPRSGLSWGPLAGSGSFVFVSGGAWRVGGGGCGPACRAYTGFESATRWWGRGGVVVVNSGLHYHHHTTRGGGDILSAEGRRGAPAPFESWGLWRRVRVTFGVVDVGGEVSPGPWLGVGLFLVEWRAARRRGVARGRPGLPGCPRVPGSAGRQGLADNAVRRGAPVRGRGAGGIRGEEAGRCGEGRDGANGRA